MDLAVDVRPGLPPDASVHGYRVDWLMNSTSVFVLIMFVATLVWIVWSSVFHGRKHQADYDLGNARRQMLKALVLSLVIFGWSTATCSSTGCGTSTRCSGTSTRPRRPAGGAHRGQRPPVGVGRALRRPRRQVQHRGRHRHANDIRVPVGAPVLSQLAPTDVIHSFYLPNFRVKQDAVPGHDQPDVVPGQGDRASSTSPAPSTAASHHYKMKGMLTVLSPEDYATLGRARPRPTPRARYDPDDKDAHWGWDWKEQA